MWINSSQVREESTNKLVYPNKETEVSDPVRHLQSEHLETLQTAGA